MGAGPIFDFKGADIGPRLPQFDLSTRRAGEGFVYLVAFGDVVKIGRTTRPRMRITEHWNSYLAMQGSIRRLWISAPHPEFHISERQLLEFSKTLAPQFAWKHEAFTGIDTEAVIEHAAALPHIRQVSEKDSRGLTDDRSRLHLTAT